MHEGGSGNNCKLAHALALPIVVPLGTTIVRLWPEPSQYE